MTVTFLSALLTFRNARANLFRSEPNRQLTSISVCFLFLSSNEDLSQKQEGKVSIISKDWAKLESSKTDGHPGTIDFGAPLIRPSVGNREYTE